MPKVILLALSRPFLVPPMGLIRESTPASPRTRRSTAGVVPKIESFSSFRTIHNAGPSVPISLSRGSIRPMGA